jgi:hypothetical protein
MLSIPAELKNALKYDRYPHTDTLTPKELIIYFSAIDLTIEDQIVDDSFTLDEKLCSEEDLVFGSCEASQVKITVADVEQNLKGLWFTVSQVVNGTTIPLGTYKVDSCKKQDNLRFKDIIAYDKLKDTDVDVSDWYNELFPTGNETYTLAQFRASLLAYLGIEESPSDFELTNDDMIIEKTIDPGQISGRAVLQACEEINGVFGHIGRDGKFKHIVLEPMYGLYPSDDLYPADDLYPVDENDTSFTMGEIISETIDADTAEEVRFEEYSVKEIDKLIIRSEEDDIGAIVGDGTNAYIIQGNFLVFGKSASELETITRNTFGYMAKRPYRPYNASSIGLPYIEVGDVLKFDLDDPVTGYVFQRTLTGIQALRDEYTAEGNEEREQNFGLNTEVMQIKGRQAVLKKNIDEVSVNLSDLEENVDTSFKIVHGEIEFKVDKDGVIGAINLSHEEAKISASKINLYGYVTVNDLAGEGSTIINGSNITTGTIDASVVNVINLNADNITSGTIVADSVKSNWVYAGNINASQINAGTISGDRINGGTITGASINSVFYNGSDTITIGMSGIGFSIDVDASGVSANADLFHNGLTFSVNGITRATYGKDSVSIGSGFSADRYGAVSCNSLSVNGYSAITSYNIESYIPTVPQYTNQLIASDTGYGNIDFQGFDNAAGVNWVKANFAPKTSSDVRLKHDISSLDSIPNELFMSLKPKQFRFKTDKNGKGIYFGLIAQELENAFLLHGLNPYDYDIIELEDVRNYTDDGMYVDGETHRINYINFIPWMVKIIQEQNDKIISLEDIVQEQNERISTLEEKLYNY